MPQEKEEEINVESQSSSDQICLDLPILSETFWPSLFICENNFSMENVEMTEIQRLKKQIRKEKAKVVELQEKVKRLTALWAKFLRGKK